MNDNSSSEPNSPETTNRSASETTIHSASEIAEWIAARVAGEMKIAPSEIDLNQDLTTFGMDSIAAFTLTGDLAEWLDRDLRATLMWEYPSIQALAEYLSQGAA